MTTPPPWRPPDNPAPPWKPTNPLPAYLKLQVALDRDVLLALRASAAETDRILKRLEGKSGIGAAIRRDQLRLAQSELNREAARLWKAIGQETLAAMHLSVAEGAETALRGAQVGLPSLFSDADRAYMLQSARASASAALTTSLERVSGTSYVPLADSVYNNLTVHRGKIDDIINNAISRGASARELAADVRGYVNPNTPGGVRYASMRLGRTELNNAFHAGQIREARRIPWVDKVRWHLSGSHPRPDACNDYADHGGDGLWDPNQVPPKPHPNCLCYTTPVTVSEEEFTKQFQAGAYNEYLDETLPSFDPPTPITPSPTVPTPPVPTPKPVIADPPVPTPQAVLPSPGGELPYKRLAKAEGYDVATAARVNPGEGHRSNNFNYNCHYVVNAMELRARGYDVIASPTYLKSGRFNDGIAKDWIDPKTGTHRDFTNVPNKFGKDAQLTAVEEAVADWPPGARGYVSGTWMGKKPSGHIFNVYKDEAGNVRYREGQVPGSESWTDRAVTRMTNIKVLRVDDLEPRPERIDRAVTEGAKPLQVGAKAVKLKRLQVLIDWLTEGINENPNAGERLWMVRRRNEAIDAQSKLIYG